MLLGIDVGGTHTDAVVIDGTVIKASAKVNTDHDNLLHSIRSVLIKVLSGVDPSGIKTLNLSTTLSTNSVVEGKTENVGVIVSAGPGIDPENHFIGGSYYTIDGSIDHRGTVIKDLDRIQLEKAVADCKAAGVNVFAAVSKFSTRNPEHENLMEQAIGQDADFVTRGHTLSGVLNFPRRVSTAYFNCAVWRIYNDFAWAVEESIREFGIGADINVLKADGGTMPIAASKYLPVESILSGPAASVMGIIALCNVQEDSIILDIGGTSTDIAVFADGAPVIENEGMTVGSYPTLVRSLKVRSIGVGGDSTIHVSKDGVKVGPGRSGPSMAACNGRKDCVPALTDAMNYLGLCDYGSCDLSRTGIEELAAKWNMQPEDLARQAVTYAVERIQSAAIELVREINEKPVYTIIELLKRKKILPKKVYVMGGPTIAFTGLLEDSLDLEVVVPEHYSVANAVGAALTRTTMDAVLFADTQKGVMFIPNINITRKISRSYDLDKAKTDVRKYLINHLKELGAEMQAVPEITEAESFNIVEGPAKAGKIIRVKCQIRPGVTQTVLT